MDCPSPPTATRFSADLVIARLIHTGSQYDSIETLAEDGVKSAAYATINCRLPECAAQDFRDRLTRAMAAHTGIGPGVMVLYDATTLYFETDIPNDLRKSRFSRERRIDPEITVGLLSDH